MSRNMTGQKPRGQSSQSPHICIVGGGFGGLYTGLYLQKYRHLRSSRITLIEPKSRFLFTPMMYELITDELKAWEIAPTYSSLLAGTNITWQQTRAQSIDLAQQAVTTATGHTLHYDYLVSATGADSRPVEVPGVAEYALAFRTFDQALTLTARLAQLVQSQLLQAQALPFHSDAGQPDSSRHQRIHVTVVGGGASGVELAGKVADYLGPQGRITLVERGSTLLKPFSQGLKRQAERSLAQRQINILTETGVLSVAADTVTLSLENGQQQTIASHLTLWAVGTRTRPWLGTQTVEQNDRGQRLTRRSLQLLEYDNVFILGDSADVRGPQHQPAPNTAQAAFQAASQVAANLAAMTRGKSPQPFNYLHLGDMITLGVGDAGLSSFGITIGGRLAALCRRGVYVFRMPTRRHQLKVGRRALTELVLALFQPWRKRVSR